MLGSNNDNNGSEGQTEKWRLRVWTRQAFSSRDGVRGHDGGG